MQSSLFDRASAAPSASKASRRGGPSKQWDAGLQQFVTVKTPVKHMDGVSGTVPRVGQRALERMPGPGQYEVRTSPESAGLAGSAAFKATADRSLVNKSQAAVPGVGAYDGVLGGLAQSAANKPPTAAMKSKVGRFEPSAQQLSLIHI